MKNKGYVILLDAIIALLILLSVYVTFIAVYEPKVGKDTISSFKMIHYVSEDVLDVLNKKGVLDDIGTEWASANGSVNSSYWSNAANISKSYLDKLIPRRFGYQLVIDDTNVIYDSDLDNTSNRPKSKDASSETYSSRLLVGYGKGEPTRGEVARAFLTNIREKTESSYAYFGGFEGQGTLTKYITLPEGVDTIQNNNGICLEYDAADDFTLKIDGNAVPVTFVKSPLNMSAVSKCISGTYLSPSAGTHIFDITFTSGDIEKEYISGGFIKVTYNTSEFDISPETGKVKYEFPGINGLINLYSSLYVPGTLNSMNAYLRFRNNYTTYLMIGDVEVFNTQNSTSRAFCSAYYGGSITGNDYTCKIPDANLSQILNNGGLSYTSDLSEETIPLRMGVRNITAMLGGIDNADVVLITDLSTSMSYQIGSETSGGVDRSCTPPYSNDMSRISLARCLDNQFVDSILNNTINATHNRVGLVGFNEDADSHYIPLTTNNATLKNEISTYTANGMTCLCCAINRAKQLLTVNETTIIPQSSSGWKRAYNSSCSNSCDPTTIPVACNITNWTKTTFNDNSWTNISLIDDHNSWDNRVVYYRKHFNLSTNVSGNVTLSILNVQGVECYLNGNFINRDRENSPACSSPGNWPDRVWNVPLAFFKPAGVDNVLACRVRTGSNTGGIEFDAELKSYANLTSTNKKYIIVMTDGLTWYTCGGCGTFPGCSPGTCTATSGTAENMNCATDCFTSSCSASRNDAICSACTAYSDSGIKVYSVGFGPVATNCPDANYTLTNIAQCGHGKYYASSDPNQLRFIYGAIAEEILNTTYKSQTINITGNMTPSILSPESYIDFYYTPPTNYSAYGEISLTQETDRFNNTNDCTGILYIPSIAKASDVMVTSYSSEHWTDYVKVNNLLPPVYNLRDQHFGPDYTIIGDPYIVHLPPSLINSGQNNSIVVGTGDDPTFQTGCSRDNRAIYIIRLTGRVSYGNVFAEKDGCNWTIQFEDGTLMHEAIPKEYNGTKQCSYTQSNVSYDTNDAMDDAAYRLLRQLDSNYNNKLEIKFDSNMVEFDFSRSGGVRSLWGPINMKLIVWM